MSFYDQDPRVELIKAITKENVFPNPITVDQVKFSSFVHSAQDSSVVVDGVRYSELKGFRSLKYRRINFATFFKNIDMRIRAPDIRTAHELIPFIKRNFGLDLKPEDIVNHKVSFNDPEDDQIYECRLEAVANHPIYTGSVLISVVGLTLDLSELVTKFEISGVVDYGTHDGTKHTPTYITYGMDYSAEYESLKDYTKKELSEGEAKALALQLASVDGNPWTYSNANIPWNLKGATVWYNGSVQTYFEQAVDPKLAQPNRNYTYVMIIQPGTTDAGKSWANNWGYFIHYDRVEVR